MKTYTTPTLTTIGSLTDTTHELPGKAGGAADGGKLADGTLLGGSVIYP